MDKTVTVYALEVKKVYSDVFAFGPNTVSNEVVNLARQRAGGKDVELIEDIGGSRFVFRVKS